MTHSSKEGCGVLSGVLIDVPVRSCYYACYLSGTGYNQMAKVVRSLCYFAEKFVPDVQKRLQTLALCLEESGFSVQTLRVCCPGDTFCAVADNAIGENLFVSVGKVNFEQLLQQKQDFFVSKNISCHVELAQDTLRQGHADFLMAMAHEAPHKLFQFAYTFNNTHSSPFFPSAAYERAGFSIGFQSTDLAEDAAGLEDWLQRQRQMWVEVEALLAEEQDFLGIDSSIAPLGGDAGSLLRHLKAWGYGFAASKLSDIYLQMTAFIKQQNPKPVGLCGLMLPCLEDFALADEYVRGQFSLQDNLFLSLHSGLGVDTYPFALNEKPERILNLLKLVQGLSNKYKKPLSVRLINDGKATRGQMTDFQSPYLRDVICAGL